MLFGAFQQKHEHYIPHPDRLSDQHIVVEACWSELRHVVDQIRRVFLDFESEHVQIDTELMVERLKELNGVPVRR